MTITILTGCCLSILSTLASQSVNTCVTSPPYFGLRDYGQAGQIGLEQTPEEFVSKLVGVFREVRRVLRDDGTLWLNLGDSYAGSWGNYGGQNRGQGTQRQIVTGSLAPQKAYEGKEAWRPPTANKMQGIKNKDLIGIPWRVAFALQADGWYLRSDIIWHKPNPMPESVTDRPTKAHEYIFLLSKSETYYYDHHAIKEPFADERMGNPGQYRKTSAGERKACNDRQDGGFLNNGGGWNADGTTTGRNKRTVWTVSTKPFREAHFATFPPGLIEPCILAGCPEGGTVLDPFFGAGTTGLVADRHRRHCVGIELNPEYVAIAEKRLGMPSPLVTEASKAPEPVVIQSPQLCLF